MRMSEPSILLHLQELWSWAITLLQLGKVCISGQIARDSMWADCAGKGFFFFFSSELQEEVQAIGSQIYKIYKINITTIWTKQE